MAKPYASPGATASKSLDFSNTVALTWHGTDQLCRHAKALVAVEQLLRVPVPEDITDGDNGNLRHVWRDDLAELLSLIAHTLQDTAWRTEENAKAVLDYVTGKSQRSAP
jgi:hypothetical protein